jgi:Ca2+-binding EF-hand superfamily protein
MMGGTEKAEQGNIMSDVAEATSFVIRRLVSTGSAQSGASSASADRDFFRVTLAVSLSFVAIFWCLLAVLRCLVAYVKNIQLKKEIAKMRAQGQIVELEDLKKKKRLEKQRAKLRHMSEVRTSTVDAEYGEMKDDPDDDDDDTDWYDEDEENMTDAEEVMRRTWQWRWLQFFQGGLYTIFVVTLVTVGLIVGACSEIFLDPSQKQIRQVELFDILTTLLFFFEMTLRVYCFYFCYASFCRFIADFFNFVDLTVVLLDTALMVILSIFLGSAAAYYPNAEAVNHYRFLIRYVRVIRLVQLYKHVKVGRVLRHVQGFVKEEVVEEIEMVDHSELARISMEERIEEALAFLEDMMIEDNVDRAARLQQPSWYHFNEAEKARITQVFNMFSVVKDQGMHRMDVFPALRRFGIKVNISQTRFLMREFDLEAGGKGMFSLSQFVSICARAQVVAKYEPTIPLDQMDEVIVKHRGLSVIEVRALTEAFDQVDSELTYGGENQLGIFFENFTNDGLVDKNQLHAAIKSGGYNPTISEMNDNMTIFDPQNTGWITRQDYLIIMGRVPTAEGSFTTKQYAKIVQLFDMYDEQQKGQLSFVQLKSLMWRLDLNLRKGAAAIIVDRLFPEGQNVILDKQTVVSILSHAKARRANYVRGGSNVPESFSPVLDGVELGEDLSRVPKIPPGVFTKKDRIIVYDTFTNFDSTGSGTMPRYLFKKCIRLLGFHQIPSKSLDEIARKIPTNRDGRMDFPEFLALVAFVIQNVKRGVYGKIVGSIFEEVPDEPEPIEEVLEVICDPNYMAQFSTNNTVNLVQALPSMKTYILEHASSASCLFEWIEELIKNNSTEMPIVRFVEVIHDVGDKYYAEFELRSRTFHEEQLYRWVGEAEGRRCAHAFSLYTDKSSVLARTQLEPLLVDLGYPVASHEESKDVLKEFSHPKDKSTVLFAELIHILKTLSVVRYKSENGRGDYTVDERGILGKIAATSEADKTTNDKEALNPLHIKGGSALNVKEGVSADDNMAGVVVETVDDGDDPEGGPALSAFEKEKKKRAKDTSINGAPSGGYMLVAKNLLKKKFKKVRVKDEVDEEGYVKPKSAYEIFVHTNPTSDQLDLLYQWNNLMTEMEKNAFKREAKGMREAYDQLKGGVVNKEQANEVLKRKGTSHTAKLKKGGKREASLTRADSFRKLPSEAGATEDDATTQGGTSTAPGGTGTDPGGTGADGVEPMPKIDEWETASTSAAGGRRGDNLEEEQGKKAVMIVGVSEERGTSQATDAFYPYGGGGKPSGTGLANSQPLAPLSEQVTENHSQHLKELATVAPPTPPTTHINAPAMHHTSSIVVPQGLSATGVPAELTAKTALLDVETVPESTTTHIAHNMSHIVGPMRSLAPPPPPKKSTVPGGGANSGGGSRTMAPAPSFGQGASLAIPLPPQFADPRLGGFAPPPPPPPRR